jgi:uncharacterized protein (AIM24 family)
MVAIPLNPGQSIDVREHVFMTATSSVAYDWFNTNIWFTTRNGDDRETHYPIGMFMDRFTATGTAGLLLLHGAGNVFVRELQAGQHILIKPTSLLFKEPTVRMNLHFDYPHGTWNSWRTWGNRYLWLRLSGPGRVAVQSHFEHLHDPGHDLSQTEPRSTSQQW